GGWDPYCEDIGTAWLLHWKLTSKPYPATTWHIAFTDWNVQQFTKEQLIERLRDIVRSATNYVRVTEHSLGRDVDVFLRCYLSNRSGKQLPPEDSFDSPLTDLGLIEEMRDGVYSFRKHHQPSLPDEVFRFALLEHWRSQFPH